MTPTFTYEPIEPEATYEAVHITPETLLDEDFSEFPEWFAYMALKKPQTPWSIYAITDLSGDRDTATVWWHNSDKEVCAKPTNITGRYIVRELKNDGSEKVVWVPKEEFENRLAPAAREAELDKINPFEDQITEEEPERVFTINKGDVLVGFNGERSFVDYVTDTQAYAHSTLGFRWDRRNGQPVGSRAYRVNRIIRPFDREYPKQPTWQVVPSAKVCGDLKVGTPIWVNGTNDKSVKSTRHTIDYISSDGLAIVADVGLVYSPKFPYESIYAHAPVITNVSSMGKDCWQVRKLTL